MADVPNQAIQLTNLNSVRDAQQYLISVHPSNQHSLCAEHSPECHEPYDKRSSTIPPPHGNHDLIFCSVLRSDGIPFIPEDSNND